MNNKCYVQAHPSQENFKRREIQQTPKGLTSDANNKINCRDYQELQVPRYPEKIIAAHK